MRGYDSLFEHIARDFDRLAEKDSAKSRHLAKRLHELRLQALQLIRSALQDGLFPEFRGFLENLRPLFARNPLLPSDAPDWSEPLLVWVHHVISFVGQRFPGRIPDGFGLYAVHTEPGLCRVETHPPGTPIPPHLAEFWRKEGYPQNTKALRRNSIRIEDSYNEDDWVDRLQREAKSDAAICRVLAEISSPDREKGVNDPSDDAYKSVRNANESWVLKLTKMLRALPNEWDDRRGPEFDCLSSDERAAIQGRRLDCLSTAGRLLIKAILDYGWLPSTRLLDLEDKANWARDGERTKLYERRAILFLGIFVESCIEQSGQLPQDMPPLMPLKCHHTGFRPEDFSRDKFAETCDAIAWLMEATAGQGSEAAGRPDVGRPGDRAGSNTSTEQTPREEPTLADRLKPATHGPDFRDVNWYGTKHVFSPNQAACIRILWEAWEQGNPWVSDGTVLQKSGVGDRQRLRDVFKNHPAWGTMIVQGPQQDLHGLQEPPKKP